MKKLLPFLGVLSLAVFFIGCEEEEPTEPTKLAPPTNLTIAVAGADSLSLTLTWDASADTVDGYLVYFEDDVIDTVTATKSLTYTDTPTSLGDYKVTAYKGNKESDPTSKVSSQLVEVINQGPVYIVPSPLGPSGYGWASDGTGSTYSLGTVDNRQNTDKVDFVFDSDTTLTNPHTFDADFEHVTGIAYNDTWTYDNLTEAPSSGFMAFKDVVDGGTYILWIHGKYYVKIKITVGTESGWPKTTFKYGFQKIAGFRRLK